MIGRYAKFREEIKAFETYPRSNALFLRKYLAYLFSDISFEGRRVLDIGGGKGLHSLFAACSGAKKVVCLEPELEGSSNECFRSLEEVSDRFPNITPRRQTLQEYQAEDEKFDILILHNSVNHLDEESCKLLHLEKPSARDAYRRIFSKIDCLADLGAITKIADCARSSFYWDHDLRNPFALTVEWSKHQSPMIWSSFLGDLGWTQTSLRWLTPLALVDPASISPSLGRIFSYFTNSHFCLTMEKRGCQTGDL